MQWMGEIPSLFILRSTLLPHDVRETIKDLAVLPESGAVKVKLLLYGFILVVSRATHDFFFFFCMCVFYI